MKTIAVRTSRLSPVNRGVIASAKSVTDCKFVDASNATWAASLMSSNPSGMMSSLTSDENRSRRPTRPLRPSPAVSEAAKESRVDRAVQAR